MPFPRLAGVTSPRQRWFEPGRAGENAMVAGEVGELDARETTLIPYFKLAIPGELSNVDNNILDPRKTYQDVAQWEAKAKKLALMFVANFAQFTDTEAGKALLQAGPAV